MKTGRSPRLRRPARSTARIRTIRKLHKLVGVFVAVFLCLLASTGIILNHSDEFGLDNQYVPGWIAEFYLGPNEVVGISRAGRHLYSLGGQLYVNEQPVSSCAALQDWVPFDGQEVVLCDGELILLTQDFQLIERIDRSIGLPSDISNIQASEAGLLIRTETKQWSFDLLSLDLSPQPFSEDPATANWVPIPSDFLLGESVTWQKFVLDVHSGIVAGLPGKLFNDIVAVLLIMMAISGLWMWRSGR